MARASASPSSSKGKRDPGRDEMLSEYLASLGAIPLLTPESEQELARELREAEVATWTVLLAAPQTLSLLAGHPALEKGFTAASELSRLVDDQARKKVDAKRAAKDRERLADALREADDERCLVVEVISALESREYERCSQNDGARGKRTRKGDKELSALVRSAREERERALRLRNRFVRANLRLVVSVARRFHHYRLPLIDLIQEGNLGLIKSVHRFDHRKGFRFSTYAHWWIRQAIERAIMNKGAQVRLPVHIFDQRREVQKAAHHLSQALGREPSNEEVADMLEIPFDKLMEILRAVPRDPVSLDDPIGDDEDRTLGETISDSADASPDERVIAKSEASLVRRVLDRLSPMEVDIIRRRFGLDADEDETLEAIGKSYNLSRERVRQIQVQGLKKMATYCHRRLGVEAVAG